MIAFFLAASAWADQPCATFYTPADVVEAAIRVQGAQAGGGDEDAERRALTVKLACVSDPLTPGDAAVVHLALGHTLEPRPAPKPDDARDGPPHPEGGVGVVDGQAYAALPSGGPVLIQAFDAEGHVVYTRWVDAGGLAAVKRGDADLPDVPSVPKLPPVPLSKGEITRLVVSGAFVAASGALFAVAADARHDWYAVDPSPVETVDQLERLRVRTNVAQGGGIAFAGLGAAGLLSVAVRVQF